MISNSNDKSNQTTSSNVTKTNVTPEEKNNDSTNKKSSKTGKSYECGYCDGVGYYSSYSDCSSCDGTGYIGEEICPKCDGSGEGKEKRIRCDGCGGDGILNPKDPGYGYPI